MDEGVEMIVEVAMAVVRCASDVVVAAERCAVVLVSVVGWSSVATGQSKVKHGKMKSYLILINRTW